MAIALEGTPTLYENAASASAVVPFPTGITAGEVLILSVTSSSATVPTLPSGWTLGKNQAQSSGPLSVMTCYKIATGSESGSVTVAVTTSGRTVGIMARFSGVDNTTPIDVAGVSAISSPAQSLTLVTPSITTVTAGAVLVHHIGLNASSSADITAPSGPVKYSGSTGTGRRTAVYTEARPTAGASGTRTWTNSTGGATLQWAGLTIALRPAAGGAPTPTLVQRVVGIPADPSTNGVVSVKTTNATSVRLKCSTDAAGTTGVVFGSAATPSANGDSKLTVSGLTAGTRYYYRVEMTDSAAGVTLDTAATIGRLETAPSGAANFAFNFGSCTNATDSASMTAIAARADDLFFHLGDLYYADASGTGLQNFRDKMNAKITAANHAAVFATTPMTYTPSDHDGMNNNGAAGSDATAWANWNTAYSELFPAPSTYYTFVWGRVRFIQIDARSFKSNPANTDNSSKTALGTTQKTWFKDQITNATEPLIVIIQADPWISSAVAGDDAWAGFTTERTELANHMSASRKNIIMLAGDMHAVAGDNGTNAPGGIAVFHAAPFNQNASIKGGPYSAGPYPASGTAVVEQYGRCVITDTGSLITAAFTGYSSDNTSRVTLTETYATATLNLSGSGTLTSTASLPKTSATLNLSGAGTLAAAGSLPKTSATANLSGSGTLAAVASLPKTSATLNLSGDGSLTEAASLPKTSATANLSGTGGLTFGASPAVAATLNLSGAGTLTETASAPAVAATLNLSGAGTLNASGQGSQSETATLNLSGAGTLTTTASLPRVSATLNLSGAGTLAAAASLPRTAATLNLSGAGTLATAGQTPTTAATLNLSGTGTLTAAASLPKTSATLNLSGAGTLSTSSGTAASATLPLTGSGTLTTTGKPGYSAMLNLTAEGALSVTGNPSGNGSLALAGNGTLTATGKGAVATTLPLAGGGSLTFATRAGHTATRAGTGAGTLTMTAVRGWIATLNLTGTGTLTLAAAVGAPPTDDHFTGRLYPSPWSGRVESALWTANLSPSEWS